MRCGHIAARHLAFIKLTEPITIPIRDSPLATSTCFNKPSLPSTFWAVVMEAPLQMKHVHTEVPGQGR